LAHHYSRSGNTTKAVEYLSLAGQQAAQRSAYAEASNHLATALELLRMLPDTPERHQQELTLHLTLGVPLMTIKGYAAPEVEKVYARARELCQQLGNTAALTQARFGLCQLAFARAEYKTADELGEQLLSLPQTLQDPLLLAPLHALLGESLFWQGELSAARRQLERGLSCYTPRRYHPAAYPTTHDPGVQHLAILALAL
jgi:tetratricopeptide (TPR) repeat protein